VTAKLRSKIFSDDARSSPLLRHSKPAIAATAARSARHASLRGVASSNHTATSFAVSSPPSACHAPESTTTLPCCRA